MTLGNVAVQNTTASLSGKTLAKLEDNQTFTGQKTFDLGASAPFICVSGAAKVDNLDADKLDGQEGTDYHDAAQLTGVLPVTVVGADPNADRIVFWDDSANKYDFLSLVGLAIRTTNLTLARGIPCGRLSLTSGTPVTSGDVTAAATLYYALYAGNQIALYNGTAWELFTIAELSVAAPAAANQVYDVFVDYNSGTPALTLTAWTNDTTRATALTTQDGILVLTGTLGKRYVGTVRTVTASQFNDSAALRHVWNYYNQKPRTLVLTEATANWAHNNATVTQARSTATNQVSAVVGVAEVPIYLVLKAHGVNDAGNAISSGIGVGITNNYTEGSWMSGTVTTQMVSILDTFAAIGYQFYAWNESGNAAGNTTFYGTNTVSGGATQSGLRGTILG